MKRIVFAGVAAGLWITSSVAADLVPIIEAPLEEAPAGFSWTGAYVGVQGGYAWGEADLNYDWPGPFHRSSHSPDGFIGGIYLGYNHQAGNKLVLGVDADIALSGVGSGWRPLDAPDRYTAVDVDYTAALRARIGYAADRFMPYVAGGLAVARADFSYDMTAADAVISETLAAWTLGAGVEYAAMDKLLIRAEYRYADFGDGKANAFAGFPDHQAQYDLKTNDLRIGIAYKF